MLALEKKIPPAGDRTRDFPITRSTFYHWAISPAVSRRKLQVKAWFTVYVTRQFVQKKRKLNLWRKKKWSTINQEGKEKKSVFVFVFSLFLLFVVENRVRQICGSEGPWNATYIYICMYVCFIRIVDKNSKRFFKQGVR